jgi:hypothetical protein
MNQGGRNRKYRGKKITSVWELRKMIEREILWNWDMDRDFKDSDLIQTISKQYQEGYQIYAVKAIQTIVGEGNNTFEQYTHEPKKNVSNFKSFGEKTLENLQNLFKERSKKEDQLQKG